MYNDSKGVIISIFVACLIILALMKVGGLL